MKAPGNTKELLIVTAGRLFAEKGYEGVSTRSISEMAGVKLSAIHYHFGSKENLYVEACLYAHRQENKTGFKEVIAEHPELLETPEGQAEIVVRAVHGNFSHYFREDRPEWEAKMILRELAHPGRALEILAEQSFKPDKESAEHFYKTIRPEATDDQASAWCDLISGQILFYIMAAKAIELVRGSKTLNNSFYATVARTLARAMILEAGLPLPEKLR